jgi:hypothetical protein
MATLRQRLSSTTTRDIFYLASLLAFSLYLGHRFFTAEYLVTGYQDWIYHAYRIKSLQAYGFTTWTHNWAGGLPLWQSYQFVPHIITAAVADVLHFSVTRAMLVVTGILFFALRIELYGVCRKMGFSPEGSLLPSLLSLAIVHYYSPLSDFSYLWGVTLFPLALFLCHHCLDGPGTYLPPLFIGLLVYVHPIVAITSILALLIRTMLRETLVPGRLLMQGVIISLASSLYWVPLLFGDRPSYIEPWQISVPFMRSLFPRFLLGLSISLLVVATLTLWKQEEIKRRYEEHFIFLLVLALVLAIAIAMTYIGIVPSVLLRAQATRWVVLLGIVLAMLSAFLVDSYRPWKLFKLALPLACGGIVLEAIWIAFLAMPGVSNTWPDYIAAWMEKHPGIVRYEDRIWTDEVAYTSYFAFGEFRATDSYTAQGEYTILSAPLNWMIRSSESYAPATSAKFDLLAAYLKPFGVSYLFLPRSLPLADMLSPGAPFHGDLTLVDEQPDFLVYRVPWEPIQAFTTPVSNRDQMLFPDIRYDTDEQHELRDQLVKTFDQIMYSPHSKSVQLGYPSQTEIEARIEGLAPDRYLVISESYDGSWHATVNGEPAKVERIGPHFIGLDISPFSGDLEIRLVHTMHWTWKVGIALTMLSVLVSTGASLQKSVVR